jgi:hypothetical protein
MTLQLIPEPKIDKGRVGRLSISAPLFAAFLGLPKSLAVKGAFARGNDEVVLEIAGAEMPECRKGCVPQQVTLICHVERRDGKDFKFFSWSHMPEARWLWRVDDFDGYALGPEG